MIVLFTGINSFGQVVTSSADDGSTGTLRRQEAASEGGGLWNGSAIVIVTNTVDL